MYKYNKNIKGQDDKALDSVYNFAENRGIYIPINISDFIVQDIDLIETEQGLAYVQINLVSGRSFRFTNTRQKIKRSFIWAIGSTTIL